MAIFFGEKAVNILIIGDSSDYHASHIKNALTEKGINAFYFKTSLFPSKHRISWRPIHNNGTIQLKGATKIELSDIHAVYWRSYSGVSLPNLDSKEIKRVATNDSMSVLRTMMNGSRARWVNSWPAFQFHQEKPLQLTKACEMGLTIPETLVSNNAQEIVDFAQSFPSTIFKPVYGGAHTGVVTKEHLDPKRLETVLRLSPVTIQQCIEGTNIRVYVIGKKIFAAEIRSDTLDFRQDPQAKLIPIELPYELQEKCLKVTKAMHYQWTGIDFRLTADGKFFFLEANPSPMFIHFEKMTGHPITQTLVDLLIS